MLHWAVCKHSEFCEPSDCSLRTCCYFLSEVLDAPRISIDSVSLCPCFRFYLPDQCWEKVSVPAGLILVWDGNIEEYANGELVWIVCSSLLRFSRHRLLLDGGKGKVLCFIIHYDIIIVWEISFLFNVIFFFLIKQFKIELFNLFGPYISSEYIILYIRCDFFFKNN